jgi:hypothetical protein
MIQSRAELMMDEDDPPCPEPTQAHVRDLADFHLRWREFRPEMIDLARSQDLTPVQRETLTWLVQLADRVGGRDLQ